MTHLPLRVALDENISPDETPGFSILLFPAFTAVDDGGLCVEANGHIVFIQPIRCQRVAALIVRGFYTPLAARPPGLILSFERLVQALGWNRLLQSEIHSETYF